MHIPLIVNRSAPLRLPGHHVGLDPAGPVRRARCGSVTIAMALALVVYMFAGAPEAAGGGQDLDAPRTGEEVYDAACAACHGSDGRGAPVSRVGFQTPLPDFSDCRFASREPDADWVTIAHEGGPVRGFDRMMPAFGEALSLDEITRAIEHVRHFCGDDAWPRGELNLPRPLVTEKAYPEDEAVWTTTVSAEGVGAVANELIYEKRFGAQNQLELAVPIAAHGPTLERQPDGWIGGIGDVAVAIKRSVFHSLRRGTIVSVTGEMVFPTGDADRGLGKGTAVFEPFVTVGQILPGDGFVHVQSGFELPTDGDRAEREAFWRVAIGKSLAQHGFGRTWSPMIEVLGARELAAGETVQWDVVPQLQVTLNVRQHIMANVGVRIPVTNASHRDTQVMAYLLWDWFDGGFFEGW